MRVCMCVGISSVQSETGSMISLRLKHSYTVECLVLFVPKHYKKNLFDYCLCKGKDSVYIVYIKTWSSHWGYLVIGRVKCFIFIASSFDLLVIKNKMCIKSKNNKYYCSNCIIPYSDYVNITQSNKKLHIYTILVVTDIKCINEKYNIKYQWYFWLYSNW